MKRIILLLSFLVASLTGFSQIDEGFNSCKATVYDTETWDVVAEVDTINQLFFTSKGNLYASMRSFEVIFNKVSIDLVDDDMYYAIMESEDNVQIGFNDDYIDIIRKDFTIRYWKCFDYAEPVNGW